MKTKNKENNSWSLKLPQTQKLKSNLNGNDLKLFGLNSKDSTASTNASTNAILSDTETEYETDRDRMWNKVIKLMVFQPIMIILIIMQQTLKKTK